MTNRVLVIAKEWFDKVNANSYFSARVYRDSQLILVIPYQYGYGEQYIVETKRALGSTNLFIFMSEKISGLKKTEVKEWGNAPHVGWVPPIIVP